MKMTQMKSVWDRKISDLMNTDWIESKVSWDLILYGFLLFGCLVLGYIFFHSTL